jgi:hypothetical protein
MGILGNMVRRSHSWLIYQFLHPRIYRKKKKEIRKSKETTKG